MGEFLENEAFALKKLSEIKRKLYIWIRIIHAVFIESSPFGEVCIMPKIPKA